MMLILKTPEFHTVNGNFSNIYPTIKEEALNSYLMATIHYSVHCFYIVH